MSAVFVQQLACTIALASSTAFPTTSGHLCSKSWISIIFARTTFVVFSSFSLSSLHA